MLPSLFWGVSSDITVPSIRGAATTGLDMTPDQRAEIYSHRRGQSRKSSQFRAIFGKTNGAKSHPFGD